MRRQQHHRCHLLCSKRERREDDNTITIVFSATKDREKKMMAPLPSYSL